MTLTAFLLGCAVTALVLGLALLRLIRKAGQIVAGWFYRSL